MIISHNLSAINAHRSYKINVGDTNTTMRKLASGYRITQASDDAAGLAVSEKMRAQIRGLNQASRNAQDGIALLQTAEGWLGETQDNLQRMRELAVQSANGIYTYEDRNQINQEIRQLVDEIDRIASQAEFNTLKLLRGGFQRTPYNKDYATGKQTGENARTWSYGEANKDASPPVRPIDPMEEDKSGHSAIRAEGGSEGEGSGTPGGVYFHIGPNTDHREKFYIENMSAYALGLAKGDPVNDTEQRALQVDYLTQDGSNRAIAQIDSALYVVSRQRADLGAYANRLESSVRGLDISAENMQSAESQIRDADMAKEMVDFVKGQILTQSSASMLAQANIRPQIVLRILG